LTEKVAKQYKDRLDRLVLKPSRGGVFEVRVNGRDLYSKTATGEFPDEDAIVIQVGEFLPSTA
jgi:selT/selW/selH-like putative selenoprotein